MQATQIACFAFSPVSLRRERWGWGGCRKVDVEEETKIDYAEVYRMQIGEVVKGQSKTLGLDRQEDSL